jgi:hypothetical protein
MDAAIFAGSMRQEGHYAEIIDEACGLIYGPLAVGGVRVIVSEEALGDDDPEPPMPGRMWGFPHEVGVFVGMLVVISLAFLALMVLRTLGATDVDPETRREVAVGLGKIGLAVFLLMASAPLWAGYVLALRRHPPILRNSIAWFLVVFDLLPIIVGLAYLLRAFAMADF